MKTPDLTIAGNFSQDELHGFGRIQSPTFLAVGGFLSGKLHGQGYEQILGSLYIGQFERGERQGLGMLGHDSPTRFLGYFSRGQKHGFGVENFKNGDSYFGFHELGVKEGPGRYCHSSDGSIFIGTFDRGLKHGPGKLQEADGSYFLGYWRDGIKNGPGLLVTSDNQRIHGNFKGERFETIEEDQGNEGIRELSFQIENMERQINRETEILTKAWKGGLYEELKLKEKDMDLKLKEILIRADNAVRVAQSKCQALKELVRHSEFEPILREYDRRNCVLLGIDLHGEWENPISEILPTKKDKLNLSTRIAEEGVRSGSNTTAKAIKKLQVQFEAIFDQELPSKEPSQRTTDAFKMETGVMQIKPTSTVNSHSHHVAAVRSRQTSTSGLDARHTEDHSRQLADAEHRERLIFVEKMEVKKQKEEVLMLVQELQTLRNELRQRTQPMDQGERQELASPQFEEAAPDTSPDARLLKVLNTPSTQTVSFAAGPVNGLPELWQANLSQKITRQTVRLEGLADEHSRMLYYSALDEIIIGARERIYRVKVDLKTNTYLIISVVQLEPNEQVVQFFDLGGRFGAVILPSARIALFDLFDQPYGNIKLGEEFVYPAGLRANPHQQVKFIESEITNPSPSLFSVVTPSADVGIFSLESVAKRSAVPKNAFSLIDPKWKSEANKIEVLAAVVNYVEMECWAIVREWTKPKNDDEEEDSPSTVPTIKDSIWYYNIETEFRFEHRLQQLCQFGKLLLYPQL